MEEVEEDKTEVQWLTDEDVVFGFFFIDMAERNNRGLFLRSPPTKLGLPPWDDSLLSIGAFSLERCIGDNILFALGLLDRHHLVRVRLEYSQY
ncbi:hypothetical protein Nepgr_031521 [Nepenthes gracilis]|uniref:Uncharacterized protein n=1 Tax=Nepenthes gracilis TaxID=150966 RepID=A0AAD3TIM2_NEPGR|nr:hypothetical protein Nepgr_031521 [Nepenthes gracilis]